MRNIGLIGKMGSGKDTLAGVLAEYNYVRVAFATPLKKMVEEADPLVGYRPQLGKYSPVPVHLSDVLASGVTFEEAKRQYPEVRRCLQRIGQGVRRIDPDFWVRVLFEDMLYHIPPTVPVVVTDVRYRNEAEALAKNGFTLVRVTRTADASGMTTEDTRAALHESETALDNYPAHVTLRNDGTLREFLKLAYEFADTL